MKLNLNCVRDIMLTVENTDFGIHLTVDKLCSQIPSYSHDEIYYACLKLDEGGYLDITTLPIMNQNYLGIRSINDLTFEGHQFLENIKEPSNWEKIFNGCKKAGTFSLPIVKQIATQVIQNNINNLF